MKIVSLKTLLALCSLTVTTSALASPTDLFVSIFRCENRAADRVAGQAREITFYINGNLLNSAEAEPTVGPAGVVGIEIADDEGRRASLLVTADSVKRKERLYSMRDLGATESDVQELALRRGVHPRQILNEKNLAGLSFGFKGQNGTNASITVTAFDEREAPLAKIDFEGDELFPSELTAGAKWVCRAVLE